MWDSIDPVQSTMNVRSTASAAETASRTFWVFKVFSNRWSLPYYPFVELSFPNPFLWHLTFLCHFASCWVCCWATWGDSFPPWSRSPCWPFQVTLSCSPWHFQHPLQYLLFLFLKAGQGPFSSCSNDPCDIPMFNIFPVHVRFKSEFKVLVYHDVTRLWRWWMYIICKLEKVAETPYTVWQNRWFIFDFMNNDERS